MYFRYGEQTIYVKGAEPPSTPGRLDGGFPRSSTHLHVQEAHRSRPFILFLDC